MNFILIVDDSPLIRRSLRIVFEQQPDWAVCGEAEDGYEGIDKAKILQPDLIVIDLAMPRLNGISASRMLKKFGSRNSGRHVYGLYQSLFQESSIRCGFGRIRR